MLDTGHWMLDLSEAEMAMNFEDLRIYRLAYECGLAVHKASRGLPQEERFELRSQLRRAAVSVPANIAEGYGRKSNQNDLAKFLTVALGSTNEVIVFLDYCKDLEYLSSETINGLKLSYVSLAKQINAFLFSIESRI